MKALIESKLVSKFDYMTLGQVKKKYDAKGLPAPTKIFSTVDKPDNEFFQKAMKNKNSALKGGMPIYKFVGNIFLTKLFNLIHGTSFTDCHTGYWLYDLKSLKMKQIRNFDNGFLFDLDMRINLLKNKKRIIEIPIITRYGNERSSIHLIYAFNFFLKSIFKRFFN